MSQLGFAINAQQDRARVGLISTPHGTIQTPAYITVGTQAAVKLLDVADLKATQVPAVLANTYHLYLTPGAELIATQGGLASFMGWEGPTFTDSGGFQVFSLGWGLEHGVGKISSIFPNEATVARKSAKRLFKIDNEGVSFRSHRDGSQHRFNAELSIGLQQQIGADLIMAFDECTSPLHDEAYTAAALERSHAWAKRSLEAWTHRQTQGLYGIVQGGAYKQLRLASAAFINQLDFFGHAIGGSLGRSKADMYDVLDWTLPLLNPAKPRHLLGIGEIEDLFSGVARGIDTFDCVAPTRLGRNGVAYISPTEGGRPDNQFRLHVRSARYTHDTAPIMVNCTCLTCSTYSRAYLHHLFVSDEILGQRLLSLHNVTFVQQLLSDIRQAIIHNTFPQLATDWQVIV